MHTHTILAVDDDLELLDTHARQLSAQGWQVITAGSLDQASHILSETIPDVLVLDRMFDYGHEQIDSLAWLSALRNHPDPQVRQIRVLVLTHLSEPNDEADVIEAGANYHLAKPFSYRQLVSVIKRILRDRDNVFQQQDKTLQLGMININPTRNLVRYHDHELRVTDTQFRLLCYFARHPNHILSKENILKNVWDEGYTLYENRLIENYVKDLRKILMYVAPNVVIPIFTVHGRGYVYRPTLTLDNMLLDFCEQSLQYNKDNIMTTAHEFCFLTAFAKRKDKVRLNLKKTQLAKEVWGSATEQDIKDLDVLNVELQRKITRSGYRYPIIEFDDLSYRYRTRLV